MLTNKKQHEKGCLKKCYEHLSATHCFGNFARDAPRLKQYFMISNSFYA